MSDQPQPKQKAFLAKVSHVMARTQFEEPLPGDRAMCAQLTKQALAVLTHDWQPLTALRERVVMWGIFQTLAAWGDIEEQIIYLTSDAAGKIPCGSISEYRLKPEPSPKRGSHGKRS